MMSRCPLSPRLLCASQVLLGVSARNEADLFARVAHLVAAGDEALHGRITTRLMRRHRRRSVALGRGCALPHAAIPGLATPRAVYLRCHPALPMGAFDGRAVRHALVLLVPSPGLAADYDLLMACTRFIVEPTVLGALDSARTPAQAMAALLGDPLLAEAS